MAHGPHHIKTASDPTAFAGWPEGLYEEMKADEFNGVVGSTLVSENDRVRVWHLRLPPGQALRFPSPCEPLLLVGSQRGQGTRVLFERPHQGC